MADGTCSVEGCPKPAVKRGMCERHYRRQLRSERDPCSIEGCEKLIYRYGWCDSHYRRWRLYGDPLFFLRGGPKAATCSVEGCPKPPQTAGMCSMHYARWHRHGDVNARFPVRTPDEDVTYFSFHTRIRKTRGRAAEYKCVECGGPARDWAHIHGTDPRVIDNYQPMCHRCHVRYDRDTYTNPQAQAKWRAGVAAYWTPERRAENGRQVRERNARQRASEGGNDGLW